MTSEHPVENTQRPSPASGAAPREPATHVPAGQESEVPVRAVPSTVLVMNHNRDPLAELCAALARSGYAVQVADSLVQSHRLSAAQRPDVVVLNPLVLCAGGVELELLETLQRDDDPVPVILLLDDLQALLEARQMKIPFRDFVLKPCVPAECVHRVDQALQARARVRSLQTRAHRLESQLQSDPKTGLLSEQHMKRVQALEWKRAQRHQNPLSLLLLDVDNFKGVNDTTEYAFGDEVLRRVADGVRANTRETDFAARFGGDEFCVLLPRVLDPFFSTKNRPDASGLGMFISYSIVQNHGGDMRVESRPGHGFTVHVTLPAAH